MKEEEKKITTETTEEIKEAPIAHVEEQVKENTGWMARKTFILILLLVVITIGLLAIALLPGIENSLVKKAAVPTPALSYAQTELSFSTPVTTTLNNYSTSVLIKPGNNKITAVQLEISYDPKVLTNVNITAGDFFTTPVELIKNIDTVNGRISYALGINPNQTATNNNGTVATVTFSTLAGTTATQTPINFDPKTEVTAIGYAQSVIKQTQGVLFSPATPTP